MKKFTKILSLILVATTALSLLAGCESAKESSLESSTVEEERVNLLVDPYYKKGFTVTPPGDPVYSDLDLNGYFSYPIKGRLDYGGKAEGSSAAWTLAQHSSAYSLVDPEYKTPTVLEDGTYVYSDPTKTFAVNCEKQSLTMDIKGSLEYSKDDDGDGIRDGVNLMPRTGSENWVHLLLVSTLYPQVKVGELEKLEFEIDMTLNQCDDILAQRGMSELFNPGAHAAQITMYFVVASSAAADQGKYFWFGIPMFDPRYETMPPSAMFDKGTSSMMIGTGTEVILDEPVQIGKKYEIRYDMLADMKTALTTCQGEGFLTSSTVDDLYVCDFNLGWELPGVYDVSVTFEKFGVYATKK